MSFLKITLAAAALVAAMATAGHAGLIGFVVEGGGTQQVYRLSSGNYLGLWGFDNREGANPGAGAVTLTSDADLTRGFVSNGGAIVGYYNGRSPVNAGAAEFDALAYDVTVADDARLFDSVWVEWTGGRLVYRQPSGGTATMAARATLDGDPLSPVPLPAGLPLLLAGLGGLGLLARRRPRG